MNGPLILKVKTLIKFSTLDHSKNPKLVLVVQTSEEEKKLINRRILCVLDIFSVKGINCSFDFSSLYGLEEFEVFDIYKKFVKEKVLDKKIKGGEIHHLLPKHMWTILFDPEKVTKKEANAFLDIPTNRYYMSKDDHNEAHCLLYSAFGCLGDYSCIFLRSKLTTKELYSSRQLFGQVGGNIRAFEQKKSQSNFFSKNWQEEKGVYAQKRENGAFFNYLKQKEISRLGGLANTPAQRTARSKSGQLFAKTIGLKHAKTNGKSMGLKNQTKETKQTLQKNIILPNNGQRFTTGPHESVTALCKTVESFVEQLTPGDPSNFAKLLKGQKKIWCGWTILKFVEAPL